MNLGVLQACVRAWRTQSNDMQCNSGDATSCNSGETASGQGERYEGMFSNAHISAIEEVLQNARARKNLAPRKPPVDIPSIHESSSSEEVDDSEDEVVRPKPALKKMRRGYESLYELIFRGCIDQDIVEVGLDDAVQQAC